jgi:DNA-binding MarR family transcriptional regulator
MSEDKLLWKIQKYLLTKGFNANANQIKVIRLLMDGELTKTEIARRTKLSKNTIYQMLNKFEAQGFLKKNRDWSDLRGEPITIADDFVDKINENLPIMFE